MQNELFQQLDGGANPTSPLHLKDILVRKITPAFANSIFVEKHYAHRKVPISECFGAFVPNGKLHNRCLGAISFGKPASYTLCNGVCGKDNSHRIYELNRLWLSDELPKNSESRVIGVALKMIKRLHPEWILVSYADSAQSHNGAIYRATNWVYTGMTKPHILWNSGSGKHGRHTSCDDKSKPHMRSAKHRYVYFFNRADMSLLRYKVVKFDL